MAKIRQSTTNINYKNKAMLGRIYVPASTTPVNLIVNGSATTATPVPNGIGGGYTRNTTYFKTTPASWQMNDVGNGPELTFYAASTLTNGATYSLSWWAKKDPVNTTSAVSFFPLSFSGGTGSTTFTPTATWTYYKIEGMTATGTAMWFQWLSGGNDLTLFDDIWLVAGPTAYNSVTV
jgi:hypothetical protein